MRHNKKTKFIEYFIWAPFLLLILITPGGFEFMFKTIVGAILVFGIIVVMAILKKKKVQSGLNKIEEEYLKNPNNLNKYIELGYASLNAREYEKACSIFNKIISQFPNRPAGYCGLGILEFNKRNYKQAKLYFEKTIELDSNYDVAKQKLEYISHKALA